MQYLPLIISIVAALVYGFSKNPKVEAIALHAYWVGLLAFLLTYK